MALDGAFLYALRQELTAALAGARIDKIHQPSREELVLWMRSPEGNCKLYASARAASPRVHLVTAVPENPAVPPMLCMLARKHLTGGRFLGIRQEGLERALYFDFLCVNELGDRVTRTLAAELMGRGSNLLLLENGRILDAVHRTELGGTARAVLPGLPYEPPPALPGKWDAEQTPPEQLLREVRRSREETLSGALLSVTRGFSPVLCRELACRATGEDPDPLRMTEAQWERLEMCLRRLLEAMREHPQPYLIDTAEGTPKEYSFLPLTQYGLTATGREFPTLSALLEAFYGEKDEAERRLHRAQDVRRILKTAQDRLRRKLERQKQELAASAERETFRRYGDLLSASLGSIPRGAAFAEVPDYYDPDCATVRVPLDPARTAAQNAQKYYKEYRKAQTAERVLAEQIEAGSEELRYLESVADAVQRADSTRALEEIREELAESGYLRRARKKQKLQPEGPLRFVTGDGFAVLVGRNNLQNDQLTLKTARSRDIWLHTKNIPGSHTILVTEGREPTEEALRDAALLAAYHSKAAGSAQVPVDFTEVRYVRKPVGARPGRVIYDHQQTVYVTPDAHRVQLLQHKTAAGGKEQ